jgi:hypothetical protein
MRKSLGRTPTTRRAGQGASLLAMAMAAVLVVSGCALVGPDGRVTPGDVGEGLAWLADRAPQRPAESAERPARRSERSAEEPARPSAKVVRLKPRPRAGPFSMNLYREGAFVHQKTKDWCAAASAQTMMNIMSEGRPDRSRRFQQALYRQGRRLSPNKAKLGPIGMDLRAWAELLNVHGYGPYVVDGARTRYAAIHKAARALRLTGRPVGLATWRGAHSWVMSGFEATADPAHTKDYRVTRVWIQDVWYPWVSTIWGASRPPNSLVPVAALGRDYLPWRRPRARYPKWDGRFMLVLPTLPEGTVAR